MNIIAIFQVYAIIAIYVIENDKIIYKYFLEIK